MNDSRPSERPGRPAAAWLCVVATFVATVLVLRAFAPHGSGLERMDVKLDRYAERKDEFDVVFLGSSRTMRGFVPASFDARLAEHGIQTHSFNFGIAGARVTELIFVLERMVELAPRGLRYVLIDPEDFDEVHDTRNALAQAGLMWHDPATTWLLTQELLESNRSREEKYDIAVDHWRSCALNSLNVGRGARWVNAALGRRVRPEFVAEVMGERGDGHTPLFDDQATLTRRRRRFERGRVDYERMVEAYRELQPPRTAPPPQFLALIDHVQSLIRQLGAEPVFVIQPALARQWDLIEAAEAGAVEALLRYDDPDTHAELFAHENRFDSLHLNDAGAALFTRELADDFAALLAARGSQAR